MLALPPHAKAFFSSEKGFQMSDFRRTPHFTVDEFCHRQDPSHVQWMFGSLLFTSLYPIRTPFGAQVTLVSRPEAAHPRHMLSGFYVRCIRHWRRSLQTCHWWWSPPSAGNHKFTVFSLFLRRAKGFVSRLGIDYKKLSVTASF